MTKKIRTVIALPDLQVPFHDKKAVALVLGYLRTIHVDEVILMGDFMDCFSVSSHSKGKPGELEGHQIWNEFEKSNEVLDDIEKAVKRKNKKCKITYLEGNHEYRIIRYAKEHPVMRDQLDIKRNLRFKERGIKYVECYNKGDVYSIGNAYFHHGLYTNQAHAKKHVSRFGVNIFYGHTHDFQSFSQVLWGEDKTIVGESLGCLCDYKQSYIKGNPTNWQLGFATFYFFPDGQFNHYLTRIFKYRFIDSKGKVWSK